MDRVAPERAEILDLAGGLRMGAQPTGPEAGGGRAMNIHVAGRHLNDPRDDAEIQSRCDDCNVILFPTEHGQCAKCAALAKCFAAMVAIRLAFGWLS